jgi:hypothetical protein
MAAVFCSRSGQRNFFGVLRFSVSKEHLLGQFISVCLSVCLSCLSVQIVLPFSAVLGTYINSRVRTIRFASDWNVG